MQDFQYHMRTTELRTLVDVLSRESTELYGEIEKQKKLLSYLENKRGNVVASFDKYISELHENYKKVKAGYYSKKDYGRDLYFSKMNYYNTDLIREICNIANGGNPVDVEIITPDFVNSITNGVFSCNEAAKIMVFINGYTHYWSDVEGIDKVIELSKKFDSLSSKNIEIISKMYETNSLPF